MFAQVVAEEPKDIPSSYSKKHISSLVYEGFDIEIDMSMDRTLYYWITAFWNGNVRRRSGRVIIFNDDMSQIKEFEFFNALMTETSIPSAEIRESQPKTIKIKVLQERSRFSNGLNSLSIEDLRGAFDAFNEGNLHVTLDKQIIPSNFRLSINGLDCSGVIKIDSFTIKTVSPSDSVMDERHMGGDGPLKVRFPDLRITVSKASANSWSDWFEDFVLHGNNSDSQEKNGSLAFMTPDLNNEIVHINLRNLGIFKLCSSEIEGNCDGDENINTEEGRESVKAELYCEQMEFQVR